MRLLAALGLTLALAACSSSSKPAPAPAPAEPAQTAAPAPTTPAPSPAPGTCASDADCRVSSNYCDGCHCDALLTTAEAPECTGKTVQCLVDPCRAKKATCDQGKCTITAAPGA